MATAAVWDYHRFCLNLTPQPKKVYGIKYVNIELPPPLSYVPSETRDYDDQFEDTDEEELLFSDDEEETRHLPVRSAASRLQAIQTPSRGLATAIGDCLLLSSCDQPRNICCPPGIRWTTSAKGRRSKSCDSKWRSSYSSSAKHRFKLSYLTQDGRVHETNPAEAGEKTPECETSKVPVNLHPHSMADVVMATDRAWGNAGNRPHTTVTSPDRQARSRRRSSYGRRPHTVAPDVPACKGSLATSAYVSRRMKYLLDSRASICPSVLTDEILPLYEGDDTSAPIDLLDGDGEGVGQADGLLTGKKCRRFRKRVLNYLRKRRVLESFEKKPKTDVSALSLYG